MSNSVRNPAPPPPAIVAVRMGYGHLRAAAALADQWRCELTEADRPPAAGTVDRIVWALARRGYHSLSRLSQSRRGLPLWSRMLDRLTAIAESSPDHHPEIPGSVKLLDTLVRLGFGRTLGRRLHSRNLPAVCTFYANAVAVESHSSVPVACVVTDSFVHRVWAPVRPETSRITYLVPTSGTADCLAGYGVAAHRIRVTGFPLPPELVGDNGCETLERNFVSRQRRLRRHAATNDGRDAPPLRLTVAVGGAGAHAERGRELLDELHAALSAGWLRLTLVAGTHRWVARRFHRWTGEAIDRGLPPGAVEVLAEESFPEYYRRFNSRLADTDILWTKPSELVFYTALGLPLILEAPVGDHERHNRALVVGAGAAVDRPVTENLARWLRRQVRTERLADAATSGRRELEPRGAVKIASVCSTELNEEFTRS